MNISEALESKLAALRLSLTAQADGYEDRDHRRRFGKYERRTLKHAEPYFWSRQITGVAWEVLGPTCVDFTRSTFQASSPSFFRTASM